MISYWWDYSGKDWNAEIVRWVFILKVERMILMICWVFGWELVLKCVFCCLINFLKQNLRRKLLTFEISFRHRLRFIRNFLDGSNFCCNLTFFSIFDTGNDKCIIGLSKVLRYVFLNLMTIDKFFTVLLLPKLLVFWQKLSLSQKFHG